MDFILNGEGAIEVKGKNGIGTRDLKGIHALREEGLLKKYIVVCRETRERITDGIEILPFQIFIERLWADDL